ncbi:filamentous hemagglutinin N-terminal domain-containing protein [Phormidium sp. CLA17]|uniref:beta strand repeat-containing protein n=1 Tax=Leptolyngbya sp. Cla-17 TaxID=2803751 RepID=UPI0019333309|nr:filamentous hemagglutinin N-terminal domain-containing protein [Leptolyngbya sp. Cla-17]MBM0744406.1 filamentous hemagglutinin N-terminal domain-containing protein [Leptolyngbya sp. Cla-17]
MRSILVSWLKRLPAGKMLCTAPRVVLPGRLQQWHESRKMNRSHLKAWILAGSSLNVLLYAQLIAAQAIPDATLPTGERSQVTGNLNAQIDGGVRRGGNLFHSFSQFSISTGGSAFFNNAADVQSIFSRVTGGSISNINGLIRANGTANLFLLNPNGILFGPNASLNIGGSFVATTADRFQFPDGSEFSAVNPQAPPLLSVNLTPGLQYGTSSPGAVIVNRAHLSVAQDLTLAASQLDLKGQLQAGRDLSLLAETVQIRDSAAAPFLAKAGRNLTLQGNQGIDILALNHPMQPSFVSGGNLSLISDGVISGDSRFVSGDRVQITSVSGGSANFVSLYDPIISATGNVDVAANYTGASLLIESQSNIHLQGNVTITGPDTAGLPPGPDTETLRTSSALVLRSGQSTLAYGGTNSGAVPTSSSTSPIPTGITLGGAVVLQPFNGVGGIVNLTTGTGNISTRAITTNGGALNITSAGSFTSNQQPLDTSNGANDGGSITVNANGDISTGAITALSSLSSSIQGNSGNGGDVTLSTTIGNIAIGFTRTGSISSLNSGRAGDITVSTANGSIIGEELYAVTSSNSGSAGRGGNISLTAANGSINVGSPYSNSNSTSGTAGNGGRIAASTTNGDIRVRGRIQSGSNSSSGTAINGGELTLSATNGNIITFGVNSSARGSANSTTGFGTAGNGGAITLTAINGNISTSRLESDVSAQSNTGNGGAITLTAPSGSIITTEWLSSGSFSTVGRGGRGGDVTLIAEGTIQPYDPTPISRGFITTTTINSTGALGSGNVTIETKAPFVLPATFLISSDTFGAGRGGDIQITAPSIALTNGSQISASTHSSGQGGNITLRASDSIQLSGATTVNPFGTNLRSGFAGLPPGTYVGGYIPTGANPNATGNFQLPTGTVFPTGAFTQTTAGATGSAGNLIIETGRLIIQDGAALATTTFGQNSNAGSISIQANDSVSLANGRILSGVAGGAIGDSGGIAINTPSLVITAGAIQTQTLGQGRAGDIQITAPNQVNLSGINSNILSGSGGSNTLLGRTSNNIGAGGNIRVTTDSLNVANGAILNAQTQTNARGGNIVVDADRLNVTGAGQLLTSTSGNGRAGDITINTPNLQLSGVNSGLFAGTTSAGDAGNLTIQPRDNGHSVRVNLQNGAQISASTSSSGRGGQLTITAPESITLTGKGSIIAAGTGGSGAGGDLRLQTNTLSVQDQAGVTVSSSDVGNAGSLFVDANRVVVNNGGSIRAGTSSAGRGGQLTITAPESITLTGNGSIIAAGTGGSGKGGDLRLQTNTLSVQDQAGVTVSSSDTGNAGSLFVDANRVVVNRGGSIRADTSSTGQGGQLTIVTPESITLTGKGSVIAAETEGSGAGGNLTLRTGTLNIQDQAEVTVSSSGTGSAGNLFVDANRIYLNNEGSIRADTTGGGGNINLRSPFILLRNGSNITTNATGANIPGGNITIDTRFLIAVLNENSNISANSEDFRGGNIRINAVGIYGIQSRPFPTPLSDITATGANSALSGTINIILTGIDPNSGLLQLSTDLVDSSGLIAQGCPVNQGNSFVITGRGGLPPTPEQQLDDDAEWSDRRRLVVAQQASHSTPSYTLHPTSHHPAPIVEVTRVQIAPTGEIFLVTNQSDSTVQNWLNSPVACQKR